MRMYRIQDRHFASSPSSLLKTFFSMFPILIRDTQLNRQKYMSTLILFSPISTSLLYSVHQSVLPVKSVLNTFDFSLHCYHSSLSYHHLSPGPIHQHLTDDLSASDVSLSNLVFT